MKVVSASRGIFLTVWSRGVFDPDPSWVGDSDLLSRFLVGEEFLGDCPFGSFRGESVQPGAELVIEFLRFTLGDFIDTLGVLNF